MISNTVEKTVFDENFITLQTDAENSISLSQNEPAHRKQWDGSHEHSSYLEADQFICFEIAYDDLRNTIKLIKETVAISAFKQRLVLSETWSAMHKLRLLNSMMNSQLIQWVSPANTPTTL